MPTLNLTHEQQAILTCAADTDDHILIDAKAGSGKTSTLLELLPLLRGTTLLSAFNKALLRTSALRLLPSLPSSSRPA